MSRRKCCYKGCQGNSQGVAASFFRFPGNDDDRLLDWIIRSGSSEELQDLPILKLREKRICSLHFPLDAFQNSLRQKLNRTAVPLMIDSSVEIENRFDEIVTLTDLLPNSSQGPPTIASKTLPIINATDDTATTRHETDTATTTIRPDTKFKQNQIFRRNKQDNKTRRQIRNLKLKLLRRTTNSKGSKVIDSKDIGFLSGLKGAPLTFVKAQLRVGKKVSQWSEKEKELGLALFYRSPKSYKAMLRMGFKLPSVRTVRNWVNILDLKPGISTELFSKLGNAVATMDGREKQCVVMFDEMTIKKWLNYNRKLDCVEGFEDYGELDRSEKLASHALVFMVRGLTYNWKMPVAYYLLAGPVTADKLLHIFNSIIDSLTSIGLQVRAFACDQGGPNQKLFRLLGIDDKNPFIVVGDRKIYGLFDFPHLIKSLRNNLLKYDFVVGDGGLITWGGLRYLYEIDSKGVARSVPKLSPQHIFPGPFDKMNVKLATQVFSHSVHAALLALASTTVDSETQDELTNLGDFIGKINNIFDAMNSKTLFDRNPNRKPLNTDDTRSTEILQDALQWLPHLQVSHHTAKNPPTFENLILSITSILKLWGDLQSEGVKYLLTSRLQQDPVENLFSIVRQRVSYGTNPTATQFRQNLQQIISNRLLIPPKIGNCENDDDKIMDLKSLSIPTDTEINRPNTCTNDDQIDGLDYLEGSGVDVVEEDVDDSFEVELVKDRVSLEDNAIYYFSGFSVKKNLAKFNCDRCKEILLDSRRKSVSSEQVLQFFKAYPTRNQAPLGNLVASSEVYWQVASNHLRLFGKYYPEIGYKYNVVELLVKKIINQDEKRRNWFQDSCRDHRIFLLRSLLISRIVRGLQWSSTEARESRKRRYLGNSSSSSAMKKFKGN